MALAPTGSGKTLAAFLAAISDLVSGLLPADELSVLYVSPLKALNEDIRRNLELPLSEIGFQARLKGAAIPDIRVATRSGDTPEADRRRFLKHPPSILCTTPESLAILLDSPRARPTLSTVRLLVLDEIHSVAGTKRGAHLAVSVGRLALLAGEFRRVALSATLRPPEVVAAWVGGQRLIGRENGVARYEPRRVSIIDPPIEKKVSLSVDWPPSAVLPARASGAGAATDADPDENRYAAIVPAIIERVAANRTTIVFCDARRRAERIAFLLNEAAGEGTAWAHHGSLAREARLVVEERLKAGELRCVVATASLELGIDIGGVDEVLLAGSPPTVSAALQRAGRSGHGVGEVSTARIYPFHGADLIAAAACVAAAAERDIEATRPIVNPLDLLAQAILALTAEGEKTIDTLYDTIRSFPPFEGLPRALFDSTLEMLAGRYSDARVRELEPRLYCDRETGFVRAREGMRVLLNSAGGSIPDRGLYSMRLKGGGTRIGELDEEFVWERRPGDAFTLGAQSWRITSIGPESVEVVPLGREADFMPFWKAEARYRSPGIALRILELLDRLGPLGEEEARTILEGEHGFSTGASLACARFIAAQRAAQGSVPLPGKRSLALESYADPSKRGGMRSLALHTLRGGAINEPLALAIAQAWEEAGGLRLEAQADDDSILFLAPEESGDEGAALRIAALSRSLGDPRRVEALLRSRLEGSGIFAAQFRENAGRALLLPRGLPGKRIPFWITRLRAKRLYDAVRSSVDFPIVAETWRSCLVDLFDLEGLEDLCSGLSNGSITLGVFDSRKPSPLARGVVWRETNEFLYRPEKFGESSSVSDNVIAEAIASSRLRPRLDPLLIEDFSNRLKRLLPGWAPGDPIELAEWARERVLIPADEIDALLAASELPDGDEGRRNLLAHALDPNAGGRLRKIRLEGASVEAFAHAERIDAIVGDPAAHLPEWLRREGPVSVSRIASIFGLPQERILTLLDRLAEEGLLVFDALRRGSEHVEAVDAENLEILLRLSRKAARPRVDARPAKDLFRLVARLQGIGSDGKISNVLNQLSGYPCPAALWESDIFGLRVRRYMPALLDEALFGESRLWFGAGKGSIAFCKAEELELFAEARSSMSRILPEGDGPFDFWRLREASGLSSKAATLALWDEAFKGLVSAEGFRAVREGIANGFGAELSEAEAASAPGEMMSGIRQRRLPRALRDRWRGGAPSSALWFRLDLGGEEPDALDEEAIDRDRIRILAARYGIVCKGFLERELPQLSFGRLFSAMRRMELSGELASGRFFEGVDGPQFASAEGLAAFRSLDAREKESPDMAANVEGNDTKNQSSPGFWLSALDPASPAGFPFSERPLFFPTRSRANRVFVSEGLVLASLMRSGKSLELSSDLGDETIACLASGLGARKGFCRIAIETVDGVPASKSRAAEFLEAAGFERDRGRLVLW